LLSAELVTPYSFKSAEVELASKRRYRKQILPRADVEYHGRTLRFNDDYLSTLVGSFKEHAFDQVPFQLADTSNRHTNDPERYAGSLVDLELTDSGLEGVFEMTERGERLLTENPNLGVSARIIENFSRGSKNFGHALQHVLGTVDPHIQGMKPWAAVEMSRVPGIVESLDLSEATYKEAIVPEEITSEGGKVTLELSEEEHAQLLSLLSDYKAATELSREEPPAEDEAPSVVEEAPEEEPIALTRESQEDPRISEQAAQIVELRRQLHASEVERTLSGYTTQGLAPAVAEAAKPLLDIVQPIELSRGESLDVTEATTKLLDTVLELARRGQAFVDLDDESGHYVGSDAVEAQRAAQLDAWANGQY
jgi:hypothetical protein